MTKEQQLIKRQRELIDLLHHEPHKDDETRLKTLFLAEMARLEYEIHNLESEIVKEGDESIIVKCKHPDDAVIKDGEYDYCLSCQSHVLKENNEVNATAKSAKEYLSCKYPLVNADWFDNNEMTQEMIRMMEGYSNYVLKYKEIKDIPKMSAEEWFYSNFDCYADEMEIDKRGATPAMTKETFLKYIEQFR